MDGSEDSRVTREPSAAPATWRPRAWVRLTTIVAALLGAGGIVHEVWLVSDAEPDVLFASVLMLSGVPIGVWLEYLRR